jgi:protease II
MSPKPHPGVPCSVTAILTLAFSIGALAQRPAPQPPPAAPVKPAVDHYHGIAVSDPYRYMENADDQAVQSWMKAQDDYTRAMLVRIPGRQRLLSRIEELDNSVPQVWAVGLPGDLYLVEKRLPGEQAFKIYRRTGLPAQDSLLVDPQKITLQPASHSKADEYISSQSDRLLTPHRPKSRLANATMTVAAHTDESP